MVDYAKLKTLLVISTTSFEIVICKVLCAGLFLGQEKQHCYLPKNYNVPFIHFCFCFVQIK